MTNNEPLKSSDQTNTLLKAADHLEEWARVYKFEVARHLILFNGPDKQEEIAVKADEYWQSVLLTANELRKIAKGCE